MALYSISDLHLPLGVDKPMDVFGSSWEDYVSRIRQNWNDTIRPDDYVVLPGDFCWAMRLDEAKKDFEYLNALPGIKIMLKGNHDYWWETVSKLERFVADNYYENIYFLHNKAYFYKDIAICGTRFWNCPGSSPFTADDERIYLRELGRVELSLQSAIVNNPKDIIFFTHYPPIRSEKDPDPGFLEIIKKYGVSQVVYGHIHGNASSHAFVGEYDGVLYNLVSCDFLNFMPLKLAE